MGRKSNGGALSKLGNLENVGFSFGTFVTCKAEDNSMYCSLMKIVNVLYVFFMFLVVSYVLYYLYKNY